MRIFVADVQPLFLSDRLEQLYHLSDPKRCARADRLRDVKDKALCLGAGALLTFALGENAGPVGLSGNGKPFLLGHPEVHFNLSHSSQKVMCAVSDSEVGCDLEKIRAIDMRIARRFFSEGEVDYLESLEDETQRQREFFRIWTRKESYVKTTGRGISDHMGSFDVLRGVEGYSFYEWDRADDYCYSACTEGLPETTQFQEYSWKEIIGKEWM